jgi:hypothetical protein
MKMETRKDGQSPAESLTATQEKRMDNGGPAKAEAKKPGPLQRAWAKLDLNLGTFMVMLKLV